jgi:hypothetical protein
MCAASVSSDGGVPRVVEVTPPTPGEVVDEPEPRLDDDEQAAAARTAAAWADVRRKSRRFTRPAPGVAELHDRAAPAPHAGRPRPAGSGRTW